MISRGSGTPGLGFNSPRAIRVTESAKAAAPPRSISDNSSFCGASILSGSRGGSNNMAIFRRCLYLLACAAASSAPLGADTRIYVRGESVLIEGDVHAGFVRVLPLPPATRCPAVATADGHYVAWLAQANSAYHPMLFHNITGGIAHLPPQELTHASCPLSDPRTARLFFPRANFNRIWVSSRAVSGRSSPAASKRARSRSAPGASCSIRG